MAPDPASSGPRTSRARVAVARRARSRSLPRSVSLALLAAVLGVVVGSSFVAADVILTFQGTSSVGSANAPFRFVNGANYVTANGQGFVLNTYPNAQQVSVAAEVSGANGAAGTYALDVLEFQTAVATTVAWTVHLDVSTALVATGVNAAYLSYCSAAPTGVPDTGAALSTGTDANGNPWTLYAPTCPVGSVESNLPLNAPGTGATVTVPAGTAAGVSVLYISFLIAVTNTGATTSTPAVMTVQATA